MRVYHFLKFEHGLQALRTGQLKVARIADLNDPFELLGPNLRDRKARSPLRRVKEWVDSKFGFLCFSRDWRNPLLWSHYGDRHRGMALEVELPGNVAMTVRYVRRRTPWDFERIMRSGGFSQTHADELATTKSAHWAYEKEVRAVVPLDEAELRNGMYFATVDIQGALARDRRPEVESDVAVCNSVRLVQARLAFQSYDVVRDRSRPLKRSHNGYGG